MTNPNFYINIPPSNAEGELCMIGGIYSGQKCPICQGKFMDTGKALACPDHPQCRATRFYVKFRGVFKRFKEYEKASRFLIGLRYKNDEGSFDQRDYQKDQPLGFSNLAAKWLEVKKTEVRCFRNLKGHMAKACEFFGNRNIKDIGYAELEDFQFSLPNTLSGKTKKDIFTTIHTFYSWLRKRKIIRLDQFPEFPMIQFELGWRKTVDKATQMQIIEEVKRISYAINPKIHLGILWLATYASIRPIELLNVKEQDFDLSNGLLYICHNKERKPKRIYLLAEDVELLKSFSKSFPQCFFFRHGKRKGVNSTNAYQFGKDYFYKWWKKACHNLGIEGVDLYGGTRHSSVIALGDHYTPEEIKADGTQHATNKAFDRYYQMKADKRREISTRARNSMSNVLQFKARNET